MAAPAILVTSALLAAHGDALRRVVATASAPHRLLEPEPAAAAAGLDGIEVAFVSTDLMGASSNTAVNTLLADYLGLLARAPDLRWLHLCSAGADRPEYRALMQRGVVVTHSSGANAQAVSHTAMAALLAFAREVPLWVRETDARRWTPRRTGPIPADLAGSRATVVGLGAIGREIARLAQAFGLHVTGVRRSPQPDAGCERVIPVSQLGSALPTTDWLFLACPLNDETRGLVDAGLLAQLPPQARLINVGRGAVVVEAALDAALRSGRLAGAYSDVFATEPLPADSALWTAPNFLLSAHSAGMSQGFAGRTVQMFIANLQRWLAGEPLHQRVAAAA
jgi:phosphoglycerate dehydrogenase-like enzyme